MSKDRRAAIANTVATKRSTKRKKPVHKVEHVAARASGEKRAEEVHSTPRELIPDWKRFSALEAPPPRPGMTQRWIRTAVGLSADPKNVSRKFREGWQPRKAETVPDGYSPPIISFQQFGDVIGVEDVILCERPEKMTRQRNAYYRKKTQRMTQAVEEDLHRVEVPGLPIEYSSRTRVQRRVRRPMVDPHVDEDLSEDYTIGEGVREDE